MEIILTGEPKSTNNLYRSVCRGKFPTVYMSESGKSLKTSYQNQARKQYRGKIVDKDLYVVVKLFFKTKRKFDIDNANKILLDSLTGIVWKDDSQIQEMLIIKGYDKENPRIELKIEEL